jgi:hypothetical protein
MRKLLLIGLIPMLALAACGNPTVPCLATENDYAVVLDIKKHEGMSVWPVRMRRANKTVIICAVSDFRAEMLQPGDILQGPLDDRYYYYYSRS